MRVAGVAARTPVRFAKCFVMTTLNEGGDERLMALAAGCGQISRAEPTLRMRRRQNPTMGPALILCPRVTAMTPVTAHPATFMDRDVPFGIPTGKFKWIGEAGVAPDTLVTAEGGHLVLPT